MRCPALVEGFANVARWARYDGRAPGRAEGDEVLSDQPTPAPRCWLCPSVIPRAFIQS